MPLADYNANLDALRFAAGRTILPTTLSAEELALLPVVTREMALASAGVTSAEVLNFVNDRVAKMASGLHIGPGETPNFARVRADLKELLTQINYLPADPSHEGTIQDLRNNGRIKVLIQTPLRLAQGWGARKRDLSPAVRMLYPAYEFKRGFVRRVPRGYKLKKGVLVAETTRYWQDRWLRAGGRLYDGRMIATIDDPVWAKLSRFGVPYGPMDYNTGFVQESLGAAECLKLGVVTREDLRALRAAAIAAKGKAKEATTVAETGDRRQEPGQRGAVSAERGAIRPPDSIRKDLLSPVSLIESFQADVSRFFPALRLALAKVLKGIFTLDENNVLVPTTATAAATTTAGGSTP